MDAEGPAMPFDDTASALDAQAATWPERSFGAATGERTGDFEEYRAFDGGSGNANRIQIARQLAKQREQIFEQNFQ